MSDYVELKEKLRDDELNGVAEIIDLIEIMHPAAAAIDALEAESAMRLSRIEWETDQHVMAEMARDDAIQRAEAAEARELDARTARANAQTGRDALQARVVELEERNKTREDGIMRAALGGKK